MDSAKHRNLFKYLKKKVYRKRFTKQDKTILRKFAKKFEYHSKLESLFYVAKEEDGTTLRRLVITEEESSYRRILSDSSLTLSFFLINLRFLDNLISLHSLHSLHSARSARSVQFIPLIRFISQGKLIRKNDRVKLYPEIILL